MSFPHGRWLLLPACLLIFALVSTVGLSSARASGFDAPQYWSQNSDFKGSDQNAAGDFNGDGKDDLVAWNDNSTAVVLSTGTGFRAPQYWSQSSVFVGSRQNAVGDFNGDGKSDLVAWNDNSTAVVLSTGTAFAAPQYWSQNSVFVGSVQNAVGDFNGDGKDDLVAWNDNSTAVVLSTGTAFAAPQYWSQNSVFVGSRQNAVGDVNGDGKDDLVAWNGNSTAVMLSTGTGFAAPVYWSQNSDFNGSVQNAAGDFNGDGKSDLVAWNASNTAVAVSVGTSFGVPRYWSQNSDLNGSKKNVVGDFNGDGRDDLAAWNDTSVAVATSSKPIVPQFHAPAYWSQNSIFTGSKQDAAGDFNGDGKSDLVAWNDNSTAVVLSTGTGFRAPQYWSQNSIFTGSVTHGVGDFNGDGRDDLVAWNDNSTAVVLSTGTAFVAPQYWSQSSVFVGSVQNAVGDFNGDGKDDLVAWNDNSTAVALSTGTAFAAPVYWSQNSVFKGSVQNAVGDFNGDGRDDLVAWNDSTTAVMLSTGTGFAAPQYWSQSSVFKGSEKNAVADVNGDGKFDLVAWNDTSTAVMLSTGTGFTAPAYWSDDSMFKGDVADVVGDVDGDCSDDLIAWNAYSTAAATSSHPSQYTTSCTYGGRNHSVDTSDEVSRVITAVDGAGSEESASAIVSGLKPADSARLDSALHARVNNGDYIRDISTGKVYYYANAVIQWIPSQDFAAAAGIDLGSAKRITHAGLSGWTVGPDAAYATGWRYGNASGTMHSVDTDGEANVLIPLLSANDGSSAKSLLDGLSPQDNAWLKNTYLVPAMAGGPSPSGAALPASDFTDPPAFDPTDDDAHAARTASCQKEQNFRIGLYKGELARVQLRWDVKYCSANDGKIYDITTYFVGSSTSGGWQTYGALQRGGGVDATHHTYHRIFSQQYQLCGGSQAGVSIEGTGISSGSNGCLTGTLTIDRTVYYGLLWHPNPDDSTVQSSEIADRSDPVGPCSGGSCKF